MSGILFFLVRTFILRKVIFLSPLFMTFRGSGIQTNSMLAV